MSSGEASVETQESRLVIGDGERSLALLEWLVDSDREAEPAQVSGFSFSHRGMDGVRRSAGQRLSSARVGQLELGVKVEGLGKAHVCLERADHTRLGHVNCRQSHVRQSRHVPDRETATATLLTNASAEHDRDSGQFSRCSQLPSGVRAIGPALRCPSGGEILQMFG
jgi:hypothetical protein